MNSVCLSTAYLAPVSYYCLMMSHDTVLVEQHENYIKQTYRNRANIMTANGTMPLTIPVEHSRGEKIPIRDLKISDHGNWRHLHWQALQSAYDKSPFFEYYADDFRPFYEDKPTTFLFDYNLRLQELVCGLINMHPQISLTASYEKEGDFVDMRNAVTPKKQSILNDIFAGQGETSDTVYWQVFAVRHGFVPDLSIVDLLFNMGPEALTVLHRYAKAMALQQNG